MTQQPPIGDYALIGDTRSAALCSRSGSIDWLCWPRFDSEPVFGRLLDADRGGSFAIVPDDLRSSSRAYREGSSVLETTWRTATGEAILTEGMVLEVGSALLPQALLVRNVRCVRGSVRIRIGFDPRVGFSGRPFRSQRRSDAVVCASDGLAIALQGSPELAIEAGSEKTIDLGDGRAVTLVLGMSEAAPLVFVDPDHAFGLLEATDAWWREWSRELRYDGPFRDAVVRSLLTLQLLTYSPSGAPVAAPTTSLPETIGGSLNWDYRYSWPRDASIGVAAFVAAGKKQEAHSFMHWLLHASRLTRPRLQVLYTIYGRRGPSERELGDVSGYRGSSPVRIGNAAMTQHQLDVYGWVVDAAYLLEEAGQRLHGETWRALAAFVDFVAGHWKEPDAGIWEMRGQPDHHVHSKLMAWLALDRALRLSRSHRVRARRLRRWEDARAALARDISSQGFDESRNTYVQSYGSDRLDAALLLLPVLEFEDDRARVEGTIAAIRRELGAKSSLLYRYRRRPDPLEDNEGAFLPCSFWLVQALARIGRQDEAEELFGHLLSFSNDVGLFSEEADPHTGELLGNFPQAFTHAALVQSALALQAARH